ncbi:MAG: site-specific integrase [Candidatus Riflebacteria bacterium]|nr:site-specific integrase [Candidatus Riflebacteria bacterium]
MASRRPNGDGCFYQKNGRYYYRQSSKDADGKAVKIHFPAGKTAKDGFSRLEEYRKNNGIGYNSAITLANWLDTWLLKYSIGKSETTKKLYFLMIKNHIKPKLGGIRMADLKPLIFAGFFSQLSLIRSARTVNLNRSILNAALRQAIEDEILVKNPLKGVKMPKIEPAKHRILSKQEFNSLYDRCLESEYKFPCLLMLFAGVRRGEALGVDWSSIDLEKRTVTIKQQVIDSVGCVKFCEPKTDKSYRTIELPEPVIEELLKVPKNKRKGLLYSGGLLFNPRRLTDHLKRIARELNITGIRSHDLRHTHASILLKDKNSLPSVSARLGHANTRITGDIYAHEIPNSQNDAVLTMENFLKNTDKGTLEK